MEFDEYIESLMKTKKKPKLPLSMYYSEGNKYLKLLQYEKAFDCLNEAVEHDPTNIKSILKRSKCYIGLQKYEKAINDADKVLQLCPNNVHAIDLKGEAQYLMGDFEGGYLTYLEGRKINPANQILRLGKQRCQDALDNSLHPRLRVKYQKFDVTSIFETKTDDKKFHNRLRYSRSQRECFNKDAKFMEDLMTDKNLKSVHGFCKEAIDYIKHQEKFWCMETPLHSRKRHRETNVKELKKPQEIIKSIRLCNTAKRRAENALQKRRINDCICEAVNLLNLTESLLKKREIEKMKLKCDAYHILALAYKQLENFPRSVQYLFEELKIAIEFNFVLRKTKAYHQRGDIYYLVGDTNGTIQCLSKIIDAMDPERVDELLPETASAEEITQVTEISEWVKAMISKIKLVHQESDYSKKNFDEFTGVREEKELPKSLKVKDDKLHGGITDNDIEKTDDFIPSKLAESTTVLTELSKGNQLKELEHDSTENVLKELIESITKDESLQLFQSIKDISNNEHFLPSSLVVSKVTPGELENEKEKYESGRKMEAKYMEDKSIIKDILQKLIERTAQKDEVPLVCSKTKETRSEKLKRNLDDGLVVKDILKELTKNVESENPVPTVQPTIEKHKRGLIPATTKVKTKEFENLRGIKKIHESPSKRQQEALINQSDIIEILNELVRKTDNRSTVEDILEEITNNVSTAEPLQPVKHIKEKIKSKEIIPETIISSKSESGKLSKIKEQDESIIEREPHYAAHKLSIENILENLIERIAAENPVEVVQSIKEKGEKKIIPATTEVKTEEFKNLNGIKEIPESLRKRHTKASVDQSDIVEILDKLVKETDNRSTIEDILEEITKSVATEESLQLVKSMKEKEKSKEIIPTAISCSELEEIKESSESIIEREPQYADLKLSIENILENLIERIAAENPVEVVQSIKEKSEKKIIPATTEIKTEEFKNLKGIKEIPESLRKRHTKASVDQSDIVEILDKLVKKTDNRSTIEDILEEITKSVATEESLQLVKSMKEKEKSKEINTTTISCSELEEIKESCESIIEREPQYADLKLSIENILENLIERIAAENPVEVVQSIKEKDEKKIIPATTEVKTEEFKNLKGIKEIPESLRKRHTKASVDQSDIELVKETDYRSTVEDILEEITKSVATKESLQLVKSMKEKGKSKENIPTTISIEDESSKLRKVKGKYESNFERDSEYIVDKLNTEDISGKLSENNSLENQAEISPSTKEKDKGEMLVAENNIASKHKLTNLEEEKQISRFSREQKSEDANDKSIITGILQELVEIIKKEVPVNLNQAAKEKRTNMITTDESAQEMKEIRKFYREKLLEDSDDELTVEEILGKVRQSSDDESIINYILEEPTDSIATKGKVQQAHIFNEREKREGFIPSSSINSKNESSKIKEENVTSQSSKQRDLHVSDDESNFEETLEKLSESVGKKDLAKEFKPSLEKLNMKMMGHAESTSGLSRSKKSPESTNYTETSEDSISYGFPVSKKESDKFEKIRQFTESFRKPKKSDDSTSDFIVFTDKPPKKYDKTADKDNSDSGESSE